MSSLFTFKVSLALLLTWLPTSAFALTLNLTAGQHRGGMGDIAANIRMAEQLKTHQPNTQVNLIVDSTNEAPVTRLLGKAYDPSKNHQVINGIHYYKEASAPPADFILAYSAHTKNYNAPFMKTAPVGLIFEEYGVGASYDLVPGTKGFVGVEPKPTMLNTENNFTVRHLSGAKQGGLYLLPKKSTPPLTWEQTAKILNLDPKIPLGFTYTFYPEKTKEYLAAVTQAYPAPHPVQIVVGRDFPELSALKLPSHIKVIRAQKFEFEVIESLIAHSKLPVMVTGCVSLTQAMDYEKPFFYELNDWQAKAGVDLADGLSKNGVKDKHLAKSLLGLTPMSADEMASFLKNEEQQKILQQSLSALRKNESLTLKTFQLISTIQALDPIRVSPETLTSFSAMVEKSGSPDLAVQALRKSFENPSQRPYWQKNLQLLASLNMEKYPELPHWLEALAKGTDPHVAGQARLFIDYRKAEPGWAKAKACVSSAIFSSP